MIGVNRVYENHDRGSLPYSEYPMGYLIIFWVIMAFLGVWVSDQKGRGGEGFFLGLLFGPFGVLIAALMPNAELSEEEQVEKEESLAQARRQYQKELREAEEALAQRNRAAKEAAKRHQAAIAQRKEERRRYYISKGVNPDSLCPGYYCLPDWAQAVLIGLCFAIPTGAVLVLVIISFR